MPVQNDSIISASIVEYDTGQCHASESLLHVVNTHCDEVEACVGVIMITGPQGFADALIKFRHHDH